MGTMSILNKLLSTSIENANPETQKRLFEIANTEISFIYKNLAQAARVPLYATIMNTLGQYFDIGTRKLFDVLSAGMVNNEAFEPAINFIMPWSTALSQNLFAYQCILQATRIVALFHDAGHPPYSHIIENVITELFDICKDTSRFKKRSTDADYIFQQKGENLTSILSRFIGDKGIGDDFLINKDQWRTDADEDIHLHEQIAIKMLISAYEKKLPRIITTVCDNDSIGQDTKLAACLYYITVVEFSIAILQEKNQFFATLHRFIDGPLDADRLDYIIRDMRNSGVNWGSIAYDRIINSTRLYYHDERFHIIFPQKIAPEITDVLVMRYKVFSWINFHHRCIKTAALLQESVKTIAMAYLHTENESIYDDISFLWQALAAAVGNLNDAIQVVKWNDSWLITTLHTILVKVMREEDGLNDAERKTRKKICRLLNELLLNEKSYYTVLKRQDDSQDLAKLIFKNAKIKEDTIKKQQECELESLRKCRSRMDANDSIQLRRKVRESLRRLNALTDFRNNGDLEMLGTVFAIDIEQCVQNALKSLKRASKIQDWLLVCNSGRDKTGMPSQDDNEKKLYLFHGDGDSPEIHAFDSNRSLSTQVLALRAGTLWQCIYITPSMSVSAETAVEETKKKIAKNIGDALKESYDALFSADHPSTK